MARLKNKVALITGAEVGIGRAKARLFAEQGTKVVIAKINANGGISAYCRDLPGFPRSLDLKTRQQIQRML